MPSHRISLVASFTSRLPIVIDSLIGCLFVWKWISSVFPALNWTALFSASRNRSFRIDSSSLQFFTANVDVTDMLKSLIYDN